MTSVGVTLAASIWSSPVAQVVLAGLVGAAVFALGWLLLGTAARAKKDREVAARVAAVTGAPQQPVGQASEGTQGWIPERVTHFGKRFAESRATLVLHLAIRRTRELAGRLIPFYGAECPVAVICRATQPDELVLRGTLADIGDQVEDAGLRLAAVIIVGPALAAEGFADSHLYSTRISGVRDSSAGWQAPAGRSGRQP